MIFNYIIPFHSLIIRITPELNKKSEIQTRCKITFVILLFMLLNKFKLLSIEKNYPVLWSLISQ